MIRHLFVPLLFLYIAPLPAQSLVEQLGYPADTKLLIVHADDLGVTHATNAASLRALEEGHVSSASVMAPTPWVAEVARWAREHPDHDLGMHLTLTSEWDNVRWGPLADGTTSLTEASGYFHGQCYNTSAAMDTAEVRRELLAQIALARHLGLEPTHLDSHMGCLIYDSRLFEVYLKVARETGIPAMVGRIEDGDPTLAEQKKLLGPEDLVVDGVYGLGFQDYLDGPEQYYLNLLDTLPAGLHVLLVHLATDGAESAAMAGGVEGWGSRWRQLDLNFLRGDAFRERMERQRIQMTTWREVTRRWRQYLAGR